MEEPPARPYEGALRKVAARAPALPGEANQTLRLWGPGADGPFLPGGVSSGPEELYPERRSQLRAVRASARFEHDSAKESCTPPGCGIIGSPTRGLRCRATLRPRAIVCHRFAVGSPPTAPKTPGTPCGWRGAAWSRCKARRRCRRRAEYSCRSGRRACLPGRRRWGGGCWRGW
jgi:hypothetical protein